ncbi:MAG: PH domain-containing protein [Cytophagales bacterium]|nr:PH domain-containing protein [Cytophagales bacterium]
MEYKATLDLKSKIITGFVAVLFASIIGFSLMKINFESEDWTKPALLLSAVILLPGLFLFCYLFRPLGYSVYRHGVVVKRPLKDVTIDFSEIKNAFLPTSDSMLWTIRTFGNGGLFGYYGLYRNTTHGGMTWYATRTSNYLMLVTKNDKKIVITPDDTGMLDEISKQLAGKRETLS